MKTKEETRDALRDEFLAVASNRLEETDWSPEPVNYWIHGDRGTSIVMEGTGPHWFAFSVAVTSIEGNISISMSVSSSGRHLLSGTSTDGPHPTMDEALRLALGEIVSRIFLLDGLLDAIGEVDE